jgi:hypothetical protein
VEMKKENSSKIFGNKNSIAPKIYTCALVMSQLDFSEDFSCLE